MFCTACGMRLPPGGLYCSGCGAKAVSARPLDAGAPTSLPEVDSRGVRRTTSLPVLTLVAVLAASGAASGLVVYAWLRNRPPESAGATASSGGSTSSSSATSSTANEADPSEAADAGGGTATVVLPDFTGENPRRAKQEVTSAGLRPYLAQGSTSCGGPAFYGVGMSNINRQDPVPGTRVQAGSTVTLYYTGQYRC